MPSRNDVRWLQTININFIAVTYGITIAVYGATLVEVTKVYGESLKTTSITLTARGFGTICSSLAGTIIYKYVNIQIVLLACVIFGAVAALLTIVLPSLAYLHVLSFFIGVSMGCMEIGIHVWLQVLWKERSGSFFHFMNFMFGFGGIIGPVVCEPFLREITQAVNATKNMAIGSANLTGDSVSGNVMRVINDGASSVESESQIFTAFCIIAAIHGVNALSMIVSYCIDNTDFKPSRESSYFVKELPKSHRRAVLSLLGLYLTVGVTCEFGYSAMVFAFAVGHDSLKFTQSQAAFLTSLFWASYTISRVVTTGLSVKFSAAQLIVGSHIIYLLSAAFMMFFLDTSPALVAWLGTALLAFGLSPYWANGTAWSVQYIQLTPASMGIIMVFVSGGVMLIPFFIGNQISDNPQFFLYSNLGLAVLLTAVAAMFIVYGNSRVLKEHQSENETLKMDSR